MVQTNTTRSKGYHSSTNAHMTTFNTAPNALSNQRPTPILTSKGGHLEAYRPPPSTPAVTSTKDNYEPVAKRTWYRVLHTVDPPTPRVNKSKDIGNIYRLTRSQTAATANEITIAQASKRQHPAQFLQSLEMHVLDVTSGKSLQYRQLRKHPKFAHIWNTSYANELVRLFQGICKGSKVPKNQQVEGTNTSHIISFEDIPQYRRKEFCHSIVVCEVKPQKEDTNRTRITVAGIQICYPGNVGTPTCSLDLVNLIIKSVLSRRNARFVCFDSKKIYLQTPMKRSNYVRIKLSDIPQKFTEKYNLTQPVQNG